VIDFKREVYQLALSELARYLARGLRMQQLAWGTPLDLMQSLYSNQEERPQEPNTDHKSK
jgi:putative (di)nucleoside polyphosphate hydrolase